MIFADFLERWIKFWVVRFFHGLFSRVGSPWNTRMCVRIFIEVTPKLFWVSRVLFPVAHPFLCMHAKWMWKHANKGQEMRVIVLVQALDVQEIGSVPWSHQWCPRTWGNFFDLAWFLAGVPVIRSQASNHVESHQQPHISVMHFETPAPPKVRSFFHLHDCCFFRNLFFQGCLTKVCVCCSTAWRRAQTSHNSCFNHLMDEAWVYVLWQSTEDIQSCLFFHHNCLNKTLLPVFSDWVFWLIGGC